jgi:hypothetical protein
VADTEVTDAARLERLAVPEAAAETSTAQAAQEPQDKEATAASDNEMYPKPSMMVEAAVAPEDQHQVTLPVPVKSPTLLVALSRMLLAV